MRAKNVLIALVLCMCLGAVTGCASAASGGKADGKGAAADQTQQTDETTIPASDADPLEGISASSRVVAASRSLGDMWLLAGGELVGVTQDGLTLQGISEDAESIGTVTQPDAQAVVALEPDLVLLTHDIPAHQELAGFLEQAAIPTLVIDINSFDDYAQAMAALTEATGRSDLYEKNVTNVQAQIDTIVQNASANEEVTYLVLRVSGSSQKLLGADSFVCNMLDQMGLTNALPMGEALDDVTLQDIATIDPDRIFVVFQGDEERARAAYEEAFTGEATWNELTATKNARVVVLPKVLFQYKPNAKWGEAYSYISQMLHGSWA